MLSTILTYVSLVIALGSLGVAFVAMQFALTNKRSDRDYSVLLLQLRELEDLHEALAASHKRLRSRVGMRELREKRQANGQEADETAERLTAEEWKRQMRLKLHKGELKP